MNARDRVGLPLGAAYNESDVLLRANALAGNGEHHELRTATR